MLSTTNQLPSTSTTQSNWNFGTLPENAIVGIARAIKAFDDDGLPRLEREKKTLLRDSTLGALTMTSQEARKIWLPILFEDVTVDFWHLPQMLRFLIENPKVAEGMKSFHQRGHDETPGGVKKYFTTFHPAVERLRIKSGEDALKATDDMVSVATAIILSQVKSLETFVSQHGTFFLPMSDKKDFITFPPLAHSLKRLRLTSDTRRYQGGFSGRNLVWMLIFFETLSQVALELFISKEDAAYFDEFKSTFKGLSKVKNLALHVTFLSSDRLTWFSAKTKGFNQKSQAIHDLLQVTNQLESLELFVQHDGNVAVEGPVNPEIISGLKSSFSTLKHLRLMHVSPELDTKIIKCFAPFSSLKILCLHWDTLATLSQATECPFPKSLETLQLVYYSQDGSQYDVHAFQEDIILTSVASKPSLKGLKQVIVPLNPINCLNQTNTFPNQLKLFKKNRVFLENAIKNKPALKHVKLRVLQPGEIVGDKLKGENCISTFEWIEPFLC